MADLQLNLELELKHDASLSDFSGPGWISIVDAVRQLHLGMIEQLYIFGGLGTGKTHLLSAICESLIDSSRSAITLSLSDLLHMDVGVLSSLETFDVIAIDDIDAIEGNREWQEALFHLINRSKELGKQLIFAADKPADGMPFVFKDLTTRLSQATTFRVPDGHNIEDRQAMLQSVLRRRGWQLHSDIINHLLEKGPHRIGEMMQVLNYIQPMFAHYNRKNISKTTVNQALKLIEEQTLLVELEDLQKMARDNPHEDENSFLFDF